MAFTVAFQQGIVVSLVTRCCHCDVVALGMTTDDNYESKSFPFFSARRASIYARKINLTCVMARMLNCAP
jgi:hypothetical protein